MNVLLTEDGQHYQHANVGEGRSLVIDVGGFTTDFLAVNLGGEVDYSLARSVPLGIQSVIHDIEESFRANNLEFVKDIPGSPTCFLMNRNFQIDLIQNCAGRKMSFSQTIKQAFFSFADISAAPKFFRILFAQVALQQRTLFSFGSYIGLRDALAE